MMLTESPEFYINIFNSFAIEDVLRYKPILTTPWLD